MRRETISQHLKAAGIALRPPRGRMAPAEPNAASHPIADPGAESKPASHPIPDLERSPAAGWSPMASSCEPYREWIEVELGRGRRAKTIWQDLVDDHGFPAGYLSVQRFVRRLRGGRIREAHPTIVTGPGEEGQVDYGDGPMVRDPKTGRYRRTRLFVFTLGFSRKSVWLLTFRSSSRIWCELHEEAFARLGGVPRTAVLDNLKEGVLTPDIYDPELNPLYRDMLAHYGVIALPARVRHPDRKGKVERAVDHAAGGPLKSMRFESLEEAQAYLDVASASGARHHAEAGPVKRRARQSEIGMVERVEHLQPELETFLFGEEEVLEQREVEVDHAVAAHRTAPARAEREHGRLREGRSVEPAGERAFGRFQVRIAQHIGALGAGGKGVGRVGLRGDGRRRAGLHQRQHANRPVARDYAERPLRQVAFATPNR